MPKNKKIARKVAEPRELNIVNCKLGLEMIATCLPVHEPEVLDAFTQTFKGVNWSSMVFAMQADIWQAILRRPEGFIELDEYLTFFEEVILYMRGERKAMPQAILQDVPLAREFDGRRTVLEMELRKQRRD